jgi:hypothetical protein
MASQWLTASYNLFDGQSSAAERMTLANWGLSFLPVASSLVFTIGSDHKAIAEFNAKYGISLTCGIGLLLLAVGVATSLAQALDSEKTLFLDNLRIADDPGVDGFANTCSFGGSFRRPVTSHHSRHGSK